VTWVFFVMMAFTIISMSLAIWHFSRLAEWYRSAYMAKRAEAADWEQKYAHQTQRLKLRTITYAQAEEAQEFDRYVLEATRDQSRKQAIDAAILHALPADPKQTSLDGNWH
jgi:hypothetical protein